MTIDEHIHQIIKANQETYAIKHLIVSLSVKYSDLMFENNEYKASLKAINKIAKEEEIKALSEL